MNNIVISNDRNLYELKLSYCGGIVILRNYGLPWILGPSDWYLDGDGIPILIGRLFK